MRIRDHLPPILDDAIGGVITAVLLAVGGLILATAPALRSMAWETVTTKIPLWVAVIPPVLLVIGFLVMRRHTFRQSGSAVPLKTNDFPTDLAARLRGAEKAVFWGTAYVKFIPSLRDELEARLRVGSHIQFLLIKPDGAALEMANLRGRSEDIPHRRSDLLRSLSTLSSLAQNGNLECKVIDYLAPYAMVILDGNDQKKGHMYVWIATLGVPNKQRPMFELSRFRDPEWFKFFAEQFRLAWEKGITWKHES